MSSFSLRSLASLEDISTTDLSGLSERFDPLLPHFAAEALRCGGEATVAEGTRGTEGLYLFSPGERIGSVFARDREVAGALAERRPSLPIYAPFPLRRTWETFGVYEGSSSGARSSEEFRHGVHLAGNGDREGVRRLLRESYGPIDDRWLDSDPPRSERCFVVRIGDRLVGAAWASAPGPLGRLHSLTVHPGFRRIGVATDLWRARALWLSAAGVDRFVSEIADRNAPSKAIAERGGMRRVGEIYRLEPALSDARPRPG